MIHSTQTIRAKLAEICTMTLEEIAGAMLDLEITLEECGGKLADAEERLVARQQEQSHEA